jgi:hypothetical protein
MRGDFDGDGSSHGYWDTRWHSSVSLYLDFTSASKKHLEWLNETVERLIGVSGIIKRSTRSFKLQFSKQKARRIYEAMYHTDEIPYLLRKKKKLDRLWAALELSYLGKKPTNFHRGGSVIRIT